jgi:sugar phosphate isomerase/epimerase
MNLTRRTFLAAASSAPLFAAASPSRRPIRLGGPIFLKSDDPGELAREHRRLGYAAAYCPRATTGDRDRIRAIREAFAAQNVVISEVGAWKNILDPDPEKRAANLSYVIDRMRLADEVGARCCVDIAGSFNPKIWYGPDPRNLSTEFFDATVENCRKIIDAVKPHNSKFSIEMMPWSLPDGPETYLKLVQAVDRSAFGVHMDVCNAINSPTRFYRNSEVITELFRTLGKWVLSCHAKDLNWVMSEYNVHFAEVVPGRGQIDYKSYLRELASAPVEAPLMLEHLKTAEEYAEGAAYIRRMGTASGVTFVQSSNV